MNLALELVQKYTLTVELNKGYTGKVVKLAKFGAFVEIAPGKEGLLHISEISDKKVKAVEDVLKEQDIVLTKLLILILTVSLA